MGNLLAFRLATEEYKGEGTVAASTQSSSGGTSVCNLKKEKKLKEQALPYGLSSYATFLLACIIIGLTSSVYYNWSGIERILVQQKVLQSLCTEKERREALPGVFVCEAQRQDISSFCTYITYTDVLMSGVAGPLVDNCGAYIVILIGIIWGVITILLFYFYHESRIMLYVSFISWGISGAFVYAPCSHYHRMFPNASSIAFGVIALFDNLSMAIPTLFYWIIEKYGISYTDVLLSYMFWGIIPSFLITLFFTPNQYIEMEEEEKAEENGKEGSESKDKLSEQLKEPRYWLCLASYTVVFISTIYGRRAFSAYFYSDVRLNKLFALIQSFNFLPSPFIGILNQFIGVIPISIGIFFIHILIFLTFYFPSYPTGYICLFLYNIVTSVDIQQTMTYIGEYFPHNEATLMGIAQIFCAVIGYVVNILCDRIYYKYSPGWSVALILVLIVMVLIASFYVCYKYSNQDVFEEGQEAVARLLMSLFWFIPFYFSYIWLLIGNYMTKTVAYAPKKKCLENNDYKVAQFSSTSLRTFGLFAFFYTSSIFFVIYSAFQFCLNVKPGRDGALHFAFLLFCFFVPGNSVFYINYSKKIEDVSAFPFLLAILTGLVSIYSIISVFKFNVVLKFVSLSLILALFGVAFFIFGNMLVYFNLNTTMKSLIFKGSLLQWGNMTTTFSLLFITVSAIEMYSRKYQILHPYTVVWLLNLLVFVVFSLLIILYLPYNKEFLGEKNNNRTLTIPKPNYNLVSYCEEYWVIYSVASSFVTLGFILYEKKIGFRWIVDIFLTAFLMDLLYSILFCFKSGQHVGCEVHKFLVTIALYGSVSTLILSVIMLLFSRSTSSTLSFLSHLLILLRVGFDTVIANSSWAIVEDTLYRNNGKICRDKIENLDDILSMVIFIFNTAISFGSLTFILQSMMSYDGTFSKL
ncbi:hypothetical protein BEWA_029060 [Theileria equi strain WA]|uniref:Uncharacterized protein n=1 Tax=Theileria equi strain WA TaxID=1537102 RepID=L0AYG4_THEEQ|nr:hypothetical protein BEWA_029060 [Theileria equi strain WA]AFZ80056.1 hypothetical protein BEWA_029060 [Theileria equi strain WA]|eukprot:XP_004829722.1 hypothetical protein BEWA_029060 [Theileria equi strain WA]